MRPLVLLNVLGGPSPTYLRWMMYAQTAGQTPIIAHDADPALVDRIAPAVIAVVRTHYTYLPVGLESCARSGEGPILAEYVKRAMAGKGLEFRAQESNDTGLERYKAPGLDLTLTGRLVADCDALEAVALGVGEYLKAKGN